ncbi:MAG TPA: hypothetical protein VG963_14685 [Polyangiaceae bacterium]|nr:hypothetical protein [Polyangiaceae bacterium]
MRAWVLVLAVGLGIALSPDGRAQTPSGSPGLIAHLECQRRSTPGRVLCEAELEVESGVLRWGDVLVLQAPSFAPPLRARVGPSALFAKTERRQRLQLGLVANAAGSGTLRVRARAVRCPDQRGENCRALVSEMSARVVVGPITD